MREPRLRSSPSIFHPRTNRRMYIKDDPIFFAKYSLAITTRTSGLSLPSLERSSHCGEALAST